MDFPGGPLVKNLPDNATNMGSIPGEQLSNWVTTTESAHVRAHAPQQEKPPQEEACTSQLESSPHSLQLEKGMGSNKDPAQPKIKLKKNF